MCQLSVVVADITNTDPTLLKNDPADSAQLLVLQARVKELEMEQSLMQHELDNMSEVAQRADKQLRYMQGHTALTLHLATQDRRYCSVSVTGQSASSCTVS